MGKSISITKEQRDAIDNQIRERYAEKLLQNPPKIGLPISAMIDARISLGLGMNLEYACPYFRDCDFPIKQCQKRPYRECLSYALKIAEEVFRGSLDLKAVGIEI